MDHQRIGNYAVLEQLGSETVGQVYRARNVEVAIQICSALEHAHQKGIVHRDLKPANLLLSNDGEVKLGDFGIALDTDQSRLTRDGSTVGTVRYMAPEQFTGSDVDARADLYSLGCILYEMLTFYVPFDGKTEVEVMQAHVDIPPPSVRNSAPDCPERLDVFVRKLLAKQPAQRPPSAAAARVALGHILHGTEPSTEAPENKLAPPSAEPSNADEPNLTTRLKETRHSPGDQISWATLSVIGAVVLVGIIVMVVMTRQ